MIDCYISAEDSIELREYRNGRFHSVAVWPHSEIPVELAKDPMKAGAYLQKIIPENRKPTTAVLAFTPDSHWHHVLCYHNWTRNYEYVVHTSTDRLARPEFFKKINWAKTSLDRDQKFAILIGYDYRWEKLPFFTFIGELRDLMFTENSGSILIGASEEEILETFSNPNYSYFMTLFHNRAETDDIFAPFVKYYGAGDQRNTFFSFEEQFPNRQRNPFICENFGCSTAFHDSVDPVSGWGERYLPYGQDGDTIGKLLAERGGLATGSPGLVPADFAFYQLMLSFLDKFGRRYTTSRLNFLRNLLESNIIGEDDFIFINQKWNSMSRFT